MSCPGGGGASDSQHPGAAGRAARRPAGGGGGLCAGGGRADRPGCGAGPADPGGGAGHGAARVHPAVLPHPLRGAVSAGQRILPGGAGAGNVPGRNRRLRGAGLRAGGVRPRGAVHVRVGAMLSVRHAGRAERQPWTLRPALSAALRPGGRRAARPGRRGGPQPKGSVPAGVRRGSGSAGCGLAENRGAAQAAGIRGGGSLGIPGGGAGGSAGPGAFGRFTGSIFPLRFYRRVLHRPARRRDVRHPAAGGCAGRRPGAAQAGTAVRQGDGPGTSDADVRHDGGRNHADGGGRRGPNRHSGGRSAPASGEPPAGRGTGGRPAGQDGGNPLSRRRALPDGRGAEPAAVPA